MSRPTIRCFWADGAPAYMRTRHSAEGLVQRGAGEWVDLSAIPTDEANADAGAAVFAGVEQERVIILRDTAPDAEATATGVKEAMGRNVRRDTLADAMRTRDLRTGDDLALFARTGRSLGEVAWRTAVEPTYQGYLRTMETRSVAAMAAGGDRPTVRIPRP